VLLDEYCARAEKRKKLWSCTSLSSKQVDQVTTSFSNISWKEKKKSNKVFFGPEIPRVKRIGVKCEELSIFFATFGQSLQIINDL